MKPVDFDILLSDPDVSDLELEMVATVLRSPHVTAGPLTERLETAVALRMARRYAIAVSSSTIGLWLVL
ncbi:MAG: DegT/DnrJ/EryC1/StrS family aminotransferase, partial [Porticoccaceae bacterium]